MALSKNVQAYIYAYIYTYIYAYISDSIYINVLKYSRKFQDYKVVNVKLLFVSVTH